MRFSTIGFLHQTIPIRALIHELTPYCKFAEIFYSKVAKIGFGNLTKAVEDKPF
jgi:hypothetical protein